MVAGALSESGIKHGSVVDAVVVKEVVHLFCLLFMISFDECVIPTVCSGPH